MDFDLFYVIAFVTALVALLIFYVMRTRKKKEPSEVAEVHKHVEKDFLKVERSVTSSDSKKAQNELRILAIEREILSQAIRRLYEAQAEGEITEEERDQLAKDYKSRMLEIKSITSKDESIVALHELEGMQGDLIKLFNERFDEINEKIASLRSSLEIEPAEETPTPSPAPSVTPREKGRRKARKPSAPRKTEAEKRIEEIRAEVEKVLDRLGQIEVET